VTAGGIDGYVLASSLDFSAVGIELTPVPTTSGEQTAIVNSTASTLNLRQGAGTEYPVLAEIPKGRASSSRHRAKRGVPFAGAA